MASKPTEAVTWGFLPAAARLGLDITVLTDQPASHRAALASEGADGGWRQTPVVDGGGRGTTGRESGGRVDVRGCDVWDFRAIVRAVEEDGALPDAIFSNSDHLQAQTALAAGYLGLPGKDWRASLRAKDKLLMRRALARSGAERVAAVEVTADAQPAAFLRYPVVLKPAEGVASEDVTLIESFASLATRRAELLARSPDLRLIAEEYLPGELRTLETLGDGHTTWVLGGFRTRLSPPPFFAEERLDWDPAPAGREHVREALGSLGVSFGAAHTEFALDEVSGPRLVEVNDRLIGDHCEFLLCELLGIDLFEQVLRLYLGEKLPVCPPAPQYFHAVADYVFADRSGLVTALPREPEAVPEPGVRLTCRPMCQPGETITLSGSNRDYLGVITACGDDAAAVDRSVAAARAAWHWDLAG